LKEKKLRLNGLNVITGDGEIVTDQYKLTHRNQAEAYEEKKRKEETRLQGRSIDFTVSRMDSLHEVYDVLTTAQCGYLMLLQCYVSYDGGTLVNPDKSLMSNADMRSVLQLEKKRSTFYDFIKACIDNDIIIEDDGVYSVNPRYHFRGAFKSQTVVKTYTTKLKAIYREVKASDIGLIYRMLPYVHYKTNALCDNPFERDPLKIRWFNRRELADAIGVDTATLGRRLSKMTFGGEFVIARIKFNSTVEKYTFNPSVVYRMDGKPDDTLQAMFNVKYRN
jgi:hypothetical protein